MRCESDSTKTSQTSQDMRPLPISSAMPGTVQHLSCATRLRHISRHRRSRSSLPATFLGAQPVLGFSRYRGDIHKVTWQSAATRTRPERSRIVLLIRNLPLFLRMSCSHVAHSAPAFFHGLPCCIERRLPFGAYPQMLLRNLPPRTAGQGSISTVPLGQKFHFEGEVANILFHISVHLKTEPAFIFKSCRRQCSHSCTNAASDNYFMTSSSTSTCCSTSDRGSILG